MSKFVFGDQTIDVDPVNAAAFEAAGWVPVDEPKKKSRKAKEGEPPPVEEDEELQTPLDGEPVE